MNDKNLIYKIGITFVKGIGCITAKQIVETLGDISLLFTEKIKVLERIPGISRKIVSEIQNPEVLRKAEKEIGFIERNKIIPLFILDKDYPSRLRDCADAPTLLYLKGNTNLNTSKIISIVGTRNATNYGKEVTEQLIKQISEQYTDIIIVSGLAYGIDICSHKAALKYNLPTLGVLAHSLDRIYPSVHRNIAIEMLKGGGLLTEYPSGSKPDKQNFIKRNRIVAGLSDCTVVIESAEKGGAIITANIAESYFRDVFAIPGKINDSSSLGCNNLIKSKKAALIMSAADLFKEMCWSEEIKIKEKPIQKKIFPDLTPLEKNIIDLITAKENIQLNNISIELNLPISKLSYLLFELEMKGIILSLPGGLYKII